MRNENDCSRSMVILGDTAACIVGKQRVAARMVLLHAQTPAEPPSRRALCQRTGIEMSESDCPLLRAFPGTAHECTSHCTTALSLSIFIYKYIYLEAEESLTSGINTRLLHGVCVVSVLFVLLFPSHCCSRASALAFEPTGLCFSARLSFVCSRALCVHCTLPNFSPD